MGKITVLFNNVKGEERLKTGWGLSVLIEQDLNLVLFDTGPDARDLSFNLNALGANEGKIKKIAISHTHRDHAGGLEEFLNKNPNNVDVYVPRNFDAETMEGVRRLAKNAVAVREKKEIVKGVYVVPIKILLAVENVLVIDCSRGLVVLTGCTHPGIYRISRTIKDEFGKNLYAVLGGFHFEHYPEFLVRILGGLLRGLGIKVIGPNHCTGERATEILRQIFKEGFVRFGLGATFSY